MFLKSIIYEVYSVLTSHYIICSKISLSKCREVVHLILAMHKLLEKPQFIWYNFIVTLYASHKYKILLL